MVPQVEIFGHHLSCSPLPLFALSLSTSVVYSNISKLTCKWRLGQTRVHCRMGHVSVGIQIVSQMAQRAHLRWHGWPRGASHEIRVSAIACPAAFASVAVNRSLQLRRRTQSPLLAFIWIKILHISAKRKTSLFIQNQVIWIFSRVHYWHWMQWLSYEWLTPDWMISRNVYLNQKCNFKNNNTVVMLAFHWERLIRAVSSCWQ